MSTALNTPFFEKLFQSKPLVSFKEYMAFALYDSEFGYYQKQNLFTQDFITAPLISPLFSHCLANQCLEIFKHLPSHEKNILEMGPGTGQMAFDLLTELHQQNCALNQYILLEKSEPLKIQQSRLLKTLSDKTPLIWEQTLPEHFTGIVLANELLDALPVDRLYFDEKGYKQWGVTLAHNQLQFKHMPISDPDLEKTAEKIYEHLSVSEKKSLFKFYNTEVNLEGQKLIQHLSQKIKKGVILFLDYGYGFNEYYHPNRINGTLTSFYRHEKHHPLLAHPGEQDLSAHVDFTTLALSAKKTKWDLLGFTNQAAFLIANKLEQKMHKISERTDNPLLQKKHQQAVFQLCSPSEMGELVKVIAFGKKIDFPIAGFDLQDLTYRL